MRCSIGGHFEKSGQILFHGCFMQITFIVVGTRNPKLQRNAKFTTAKEIGKATGGIRPCFQHWIIDC